MYVRRRQAASDREREANIAPSTVVCLQRVLPQFTHKITVLCSVENDLLGKAPANQKLWVRPRARARIPCLLFLSASIKYKHQGLRSPRGCFFYAYFVFGGRAILCTSYKGDAHDDTMPKRRLRPNPDLMLAPKPRSVTVGTGKPSRLHTVTLPLNHACHPMHLVLNERTVSCRRGGA